MKEGGVLEQVTHQLNIEALPTAIPDYIIVDVSGMEIAATMHLSELTAPEGVEFLDDPEETIIATVVVPTEVEEPRDRGGDRAGRRGWRAARGGCRAGRGRDRRGGRAEGCRRPPRRPRTPSEPLPPRLRREGRLAGRRAREPGRPLRPHPPQRRLRGGRSCAARALGPAEGQAEVRRPVHRGRTGPAAARGVLLPQTYMNDSGQLGRARRAARSASTSTTSWSSTTRSTSRSARSRSATGGGLAGHNGLKSLKQGLGSADFTARPGRRRPARQRPTPRSSPRYVLGRFSEPTRRCARADRERRRRARTARKLGLEPRGAARAAAAHAQITPHIRPERRFSRRSWRTPPTRRRSARSSPPACARTCSPR